MIGAPQTKLLSSFINFCKYNYPPMINYNCSYFYWKSNIEILLLMSTPNHRFFKINFSPPKTAYVLTGGNNKSPAETTLPGINLTNYEVVNVGIKYAFLNRLARQKLMILHFVTPQPVFRYAHLGQ